MRLAYVWIAGLACQACSAGYIHRGHEDITRFGVDLANRELGSRTFPEVEAGTYGALTDNALVQGNTKTDFPNDELLRFYGATGSGWTSSPDLQDLHFLRNYPDGSPQSIHDTCNAVRKRIRNAAFQAVSLQHQNREKYLFWLGHSTHIIQDSFAPPHSRRSGVLYRNIEDICTYGRRFDGICYHETVELGDAVWRTSDKGCAANPLDRSWACLRPQSQAAAYATAGFLIAVARANPGNLDANLDAYFDDPSSGYTGYFRCPAGNQ